MRNGGEHQHRRAAEGVKGVRPPFPRSESLTIADLPFYGVRGQKSAEKQPLATVEYHR
jgi:hypothetical protein